MLHTVWETDTFLLPSRLHRARRELGLTQEEVAERTGVARNTVSRYELGRQAPSGRALSRLAAIYGKPMEWFYAEEEEPQAHAEHLDAEAPDSPATAGSPSGILSLDQVRQEFSARFDRLETYIRAQAPVQAIGASRAKYDAGDDMPAVRPVEVVEVAAAAGGGAEVYDETVVGRLWFRDDWLDRQAIDPDQCNVISVRGESMEPTLPDGCSILVDRSQGRRRRRVGRIFVLRTDDGLVVKRVGRDEEGNWRIESEHPAWPPVPWSDPTEIIGEVRWMARTF